MSKHISTLIKPNWKIEAWYPEKPTLRETAAIDYGIMTQQNANHDNDDTDARQSNDTPERLRRNADADGEIAKQWKLRHRAILELTTKKQERANGRKKELYVDGWGPGKQNSCNSYQNALEFQKK